MEHLLLPDGDAFEVVGTGTPSGESYGERPTQPITIALAGGGYAALWLGQTTFSNGTTQFVIRAQRYDAHGNALGDPIAVSAPSNLPIQGWSATGLSNGSIAVTWSQAAAEPLHPNYEEIYVRVISSAGVPLGPQFLGNTTTALPQEGPDVFAVEDGFVVAWRDEVAFNSDDDVIRAQAFSGSGGKLGSERTLAGGAAGYQYNVTGMATLSYDTFLVVWRDSASDMGSPFGSVEHRGQLFTAQWGEITSEFTLAGPTGTIEPLEIAPLQDGRFVAWWYDGASKLRVYGTLAQPVSDVITIPGTQLSVATHRSGAFVVGWRDANGLYHVQLHDPDGTAFGESAVIDPRALDPQTYGTSDFGLSMLDDGDVVVSWRTERSNGDGTVVTQLLDGPTLGGAPVQDHYTGGEGDDRFAGLADNDGIDGGAGNDILVGNAGDDYIFGGPGADRLYGDAGDDLLNGGPGEDIVHGGDGDDSIGFDYGQNDQLFGEAGNDRFHFNADLAATTVDALLDGGTGDDTFYLNTTNAIAGLVRMIGGEGSDNIEVFRGVQVTIDAGAQADLVKITAQRTDYQIALGSGSDVLRVDSYQGNHGLDGEIVVSDFAAGDGGDALSFIPFLAWQLSGWDFAANPFATGHLVLEQRGADAVLRMDRDAGGTYYGLEDFVVLQGVTTTALTARNLGGYAANGAATTGVTLDGTGTGDFVNGTSGHDLIRGHDGGDGLFGGAGDDQLVGGTGNDTLDGDLGHDFLYGGYGDDTLNDRVDGGGELHGEDGDDTLFVDRQFFLAPNVELFLDGGSGNDQLYFYSAYLRHDAILRGGDGNDDIRAYLGRNVTIDAGEGDDFIGIDLSIGHAVVTLGAGSDRIEPSLYLPAVSGFTITDFQPGAGGDQFSLLSVLQRLVNGWDMASNPFSANFLQVAREGADVLLLYSPDGDGAMYGLLSRLTGVDGAQLTAFNFGFDFGPVAILGTEGSETMTGTAAADELIAFGGNDWLDGGAGADQMHGGAGDDAYWVDNAGDWVDELIGRGTDQVFATISYELAANAENLMLFGSGSLNGAGNALANEIIGNAGNNWLAGLAGDDALDGGLGADHLQGGTGNDTYHVDNAGEWVDELAGEGTDTVLVSISHELAANVETLILAGTDGLNGAGNALGNVIIGNGGNNWLAGLAGDDVLDGGLGADHLQGGTGNDWYYVDEAGDWVHEEAGEGTDLVIASISHELTANAENLALGGTGNLNGAGNALANRLTGNAGNNWLAGLAGDDVLDGGLGADHLQGGAGNDWYYVDNAGEWLDEQAGEGTDIVLASISYQLAAEVENLTLAGGGNLNGAGNALANVLTGTADSNWLAGLQGDDVLDGGLGADKMEGGTGNDTFHVNNAGDWVIENAGEGTDQVLAPISHELAANVENLTLTGGGNLNGAGNALANVVTGNAGNNWLAGLLGNDVLDGGLGADHLQGGADQDTFAFTTALGGGNIDWISDFAAADDTIQLDDAVFTGLATGALAAGAFATGAAATEADDRVIYDSNTGSLWFDADGSGAGAAVQFAVLGTGLAMTASDFIVI